MGTELTSTTISRDDLGGANESIPSSDRIDIKYEMLRREPSETINRILSHLVMPA